MNYTEFKIAIKAQRDAIANTIEEKFHGEILSPWFEMLLYADSVDMVCVDLMKDPTNIRSQERLERHVKSLEIELKRCLGPQSSSDSKWFIEKGGVKDQLKAIQKLIDTARDKELLENRTSSAEPLRATISKSSSNSSNPAEIKPKARKRFTLW